MTRETRARRLPVGAECSSAGTSFRVWAPDSRRVTVVMEDGPQIELAPEKSGYFAGSVPEAKVGDRYGFSLDGGPTLPDPASRFQPDGPHGLSAIVDPDGFEWSDAKWKGIRASEAIICEIHIGTFTAKGDWDAASERLPHLVDLGVTVIEVMPVAEFPGRFGWGYDGVDLFAPTHLYGRPDAMRRFVNSAHELGLAVILDVVYNHLGPDGCYIQKFSESYFSERHDTDWGRGINFDGKSSGPVREFYLANATYWITEFHLDGYRFDATQSINDESEEHILTALGRAARQAGGSRSIYLIAENEPQETKIARPPEEGGNGLDALWNDDFHHTAVVALTGRSEAYYTDYKGSPQEFISAAKYGYLYQGQRYDWQENRRGKPSFGLPPSSFINYLENHDQTANSAKGLRLHQMTSPGLHRAITAYLLLAPQPPMLFQGQEYSSSRPFLYFSDQNAELAKLVKNGRKEFLAQFPRIKESKIQEQLTDPGALDTFECSKLDWAEKERHSSAYALHKDLIALRRGDPVLNGKACEGVDGAVLSNDCWLLRYFADDRLDRLLLVNLGRDLRVSPAPEPLLAPPEGRRWAPILSTEDPKYGGFGDIPMEGSFNWRIPAQAAVLMTSVPLPVEGEEDDEDT